MPRGVRSMRQPPPVDYPICRCWPVAALLIAGGLLPMLQGLFWWLSQSESSAQRPLAILAGLLVLLWSGWAWPLWRRWPAGRLRWAVVQTRPGDSEPAGLWRWCDGKTGQDTDLLGIEVALDLQSHVLLRLRPVRGRALWISASRASDPARWLDLRRAWTAMSA